MIDEPKAQEIVELFCNINSVAVKDVMVNDLRKIEPPIAALLDHVQAVSIFVSN